VSVASVSRVLSGNHPVSDELRRRVMKVVRDLDYVTNVHARSLAGGGTPTVAILLNNITGAASAHVAKGVEGAATLRGWLSLVGTTGDDPERELALVNLMRQQGVAAVVLLGGAYDYDEYQLRMARFARSLDAAGPHLVLVGRPPLKGDVPLASQLTPQLTSVHVPYEEMGRVALRAVADRRERGADRRRSADGEHLVLGTHVVVRHSVQPPALLRKRLPSIAAPMGVPRASTAAPPGEQPTPRHHKRQRPGSSPHGAARPSSCAVIVVGGQSASW
jgi:DNA-binding LacI/PurR family transcriptional regulator